MQIYLLTRTASEHSLTTTSHIHTLSNMITQKQVCSDSCSVAAYLYSTLYPCTVIGNGCHAPHLVAMCSKSTVMHSQC